VPQGPAPGGSGGIVEAETPDEQAQRLEALADGQERLLEAAARVLQAQAYVREERVAEAPGVPGLASLEDASLEGR